MRILALIMILCGAHCMGQNVTHHISRPLALQQAGWNKLLVLSSGNTLLLHYELEKNLVVKVFDTAGNETVSHDIVLDSPGGIGNDMFKGLYEMNGEAVLFVDEGGRDGNALMSVRINPANGNVIKEKTEVPRVKWVHTDYQVLYEASPPGNESEERRTKSGDSYAVFCFRDAARHPESVSELVRLDAKHEVIASVIFDVSAACKITESVLLGASVSAGGTICVAIGVRGIDTTAQEVVLSTGQQLPPRGYDRFAVIGYLPADENFFTATYRKFNSGSSSHYQNSYPVCAGISYSNGMIHVALLDVLGKSQYNNYSGIVRKSYNSYLFTVNTRGMSVNIDKLGYEKVNDFLSRNSHEYFRGVPITMFGTDSGAIVVAEDYSLEDLPNTIFGNIGVTQYDNNGNERWGVALHRAEHTDFMNSETIVQNANKKIAFRDGQTPSVAVNCVHSGDGFYFFYNNNTKITKKRYHRKRDFKDRDLTLCYKLNTKKQFTKFYPFGVDAPNEYSLMESAGYNEALHTYATVLYAKTIKGSTLRVAWCRVDD